MVLKALPPLELHSRQHYQNSCGTAALTVLDCDVPRQAASLGSRQ